MSSSKQLSMPSSKQPLDSAFKQQRLKAWQPILTPVGIILTLAITGVAFLLIGILIVVTGDSVVEIEIPYPTTCKIGTTCVTDVITVPSDMESPVFVYYKLTNFYQNHRRYVKSRSDEQLRGGEAKNLKACAPLETNPLDNNKLIYPCGLIAASYFSDKISLSINGNILTGDSWNKSAIIWPSDKAKFQTNPFYQTDAYTSRSELDNKLIQLPPVTDEDLIVWMRTSGLPTFRKLYRIKKDGKTIPKNAKLKFTIENNFVVDKFDGTKSIVISTASWLGGKNTFLGWAYITVSILCLGLALLFFIKVHFYPRKPGDLSFWEKNHIH